MRVASRPKVIRRPEPSNLVERRFPHCCEQEALLKTQPKDTQRKHTDLERHYQLIYIEVEVDPLRPRQVISFLQLLVTTIGYNCAAKGCTKAASFAVVLAAVVILVIAL